MEESKFLFCKVSHRFLHLREFCYRNAVANSEDHEGGDQDPGTVEAGPGWNDVPLSVLLLVSFLHSFVALRVFLQIFVEEKVAVNNTEVIEQ